MTKLRCNCRLNQSTNTGHKENKMLIRGPIAGIAAMLMTISTRSDWL